MNKWIAQLLLAFFLLSLPACMKTRTQIKEQDQQEEESAEENDARRNAKYEEVEIRNEMAKLNGKVEQIEYAQKSQNYAELKEYSVKLDNRIAEIEKNQILVMSELKELKDKEDKVKKEAQMPSDDLMKEGYQALSQKDYETASEKFRILLTKQPHGKALAEAEFGMGEAQHGLKDHKKAIVHYSKVAEAYPKSAKVPTSLYKLGLSFKALGMNKEAKGFFAELIERFPKSAEAKKLKQK